MRVSREQKIKNDYDGRWTGDMPKYLGLPLQVFLIWLAAEYPLFATDDDHVTNKRHPSVDNVDNFVVQSAGVITNIFGYLLAEGLIKANQIDYTKRKLNPTHRVHKTVSLVLQMLGTILSPHIPVFFVDKVGQRLQMGFGSAFVGSFSAIITPAILWLENRFAWLFPDDEHTLFRIGHDGWSKFSRTAMYWGMCGGGAFAPLAMNWGLYNNLNTAVLYTGAWGALFTWSASLIFVGVYNYFWKDEKGRGKLGAYANDPDEKLRQTDRRRDNYFRTGITVCLPIGGMIFFGWGLISGIPVSDLLGTVSEGMAWGGVLGGPLFALGGESITNWVNKFKRLNPWDFIVGNTDTLFGYLGVPIGIGVSLLIPFPGGPLAGMALGSAVGKLGGNLVGIIVGCIWNSAEEEYPSEKVPWTQRMLVAANRWSVGGGAAGLGSGLIINAIYMAFTDVPDYGFIFTVTGASVWIGTSSFSFVGGCLNAENANKIKPPDSRDPIKGAGYRQMSPRITPSPHADGVMEEGVDDNRAKTPDRIVVLEQKPQASHSFSRTCRIC